MNTGALILAGALGLLLGSMGHAYDTLEFWTVMCVFGVAGGLRYNEGYEDATETAQAMWEKSKLMLDDVIAREEKIQRLIKDYKDEQ